MELLFLILKFPYIFAMRILQLFSLQLGNFFIKPILEQSQQYHLDCENWQQRWVELVAGIEYSIYTSSSYNKDRRPNSFLHIRNEGKDLIDQVTFCVEVSGSGVKYQELVTINCFAPQDIFERILSNIPQKELYIVDNCIFTTYNTIKIYPISLQRNGLLEEYAPEGISFNPMYDEFLNNEWRRWNNKLYNIKAIQEFEMEYSSYFRWLFIGKYLLFTDNISALKITIKNRKYIRIPCLLVGFVLSCDLMISLYSWTLLILRRRKIKFTIDFDMAHSEKHVTNKGGGPLPHRISRIASNQIL